MSAARKRVFTLTQTVTERYFYDPEQIKLDFADALDNWGGTFEEFLIETFELYDGSQMGDRWFHNDANPQVGVELHEGWDDE